VRLVRTDEFAPKLREHLAEYNRIKEKAAPLGVDEYWKAKDRFLSQILASRPKRPEANR
jgi:hypothetical protein